MTEEIADLQSRMAFQEDLIAELSNQLAHRDKEIKILQTQVRELHLKLKELAYQMEAGSLGPAVEKPPHY